MAQKAIREYDAKRLMLKHLPQYLSKDVKFDVKTALVTPELSINQLAKKNPWIKTEKLAVKPDMLIGKRGKNKLILLDGTLDDAKKWIPEHLTAEISGVPGKLTHFLVEPFIPHETEYYLAIKDHKDGDNVFFCCTGGIDIEENWCDVIEMNVPIDIDIDDVNIETYVRADIEKSDDSTEEKITFLVQFIKGLFRFYKNLNFTYLELNPFVIQEGTVIPLDCVAKLDDTAAFWMEHLWGDIEFPAPFGMDKSEEEEYIKNLDEKTGASLKLTVLNPKGRVWTMIAGGGASVIYTDSVVDAGHGTELANYGEYSGNPSTDETYEYAKTILDLMTREKHPDGKVLIIGGGIANFTDVAKTFQGIILALRDYGKKMIEHNIKIYVRRGGPNYKVGLQQMKDVGEELGLPIDVHGPEMGLTKIVTIALQEMKISKPEVEEGV
jgi:ATP-citrate lyase beta-subunit